MINIEERDLFTMRPMQNYVITTSVMRSDVVKIGELELLINTTYNPALHQPIVQKVVQVPKNLYYGKMKRFITLDKGFDSGIQHNREETVSIQPPIPNSMPWQTTMDLKRDDIVYCDSFSLQHAAKDNRCLEVDGVKYYLIGYQDIYFKLVNGQPEMLNGWILCEPLDNPKSDIMQRMEKAGFVFPQVSITNENKRAYDKGDKLGIVRHIGLPVKEYIDDYEEHDEVSVGDTVILKWSANRRLEAGGSRFFGKTDLIVTRRPRLVGKFTEELF